MYAGECLLAARGVEPTDDAVTGAMIEANFYLCATAFLTAPAKATTARPTRKRPG